MGKLGYLARKSDYPYWCVITYEYDNCYLIEYQMVYVHKMTIGKNEVEIVTKDGAKVPVKKKFWSGKWDIPNE